MSIKWQGNISLPFHVTKGTRQGSLISPKLFNFFLDQLLIDLKAMTPGIWIGNTNFNSFAYADDVTLMSGSVPGLQRLIDTCHTYATKWSFKFGISKTKCIILGKDSLPQKPIWRMDGIPTETVDQMDILGLSFQSNMSGSAHTVARPFTVLVRLVCLAVRYPPG